jgi:lysyl endopeptidase
MKTSLRLLLAVCAISILTACGNNGSGTSADTTGTATTAATATTASSNVQLVQSVDAYRPPESTISQQPPMKPRDLRVAPTATNIAMGEPLDSQTAAARKNNETTAENHMGKPLQIGFGRDVSQTATAAATQQVLKWQTTATGGQVTAINFSSTGAKGIRIGLLITKLPETATLRFYAKGATTAFEAKGAEVLKVLAANLAAGDRTDEGRTYWSPVIKANNGTVEIEIPAGVETNLVQVSVPIVSHFYISMSDAQAVLAQSTYGPTDSHAGNSSLSCQVDVNCTTPLPAASDAVAWLIFNEGPGFAYICSGTLLNDSLNSGTPYLLTANHCISSQTSASTLRTEFKYRSLTCNNATTGEYFPTATTGSSLLYTAYGTDSTLLRLYGTPSTTVLFAGWDATTMPALATPTHGVHHPAGDQQRISRGTVDNYFIRNPDQTQIYSFFSSAPASSTILSVKFTSGVVEGGSSGSGLFKGAESNPQLIGQLFGGQQATCLSLNSPTSNPQSTVYGRFDVAYTAGMSDWLNPTGIKPVYRFYNTIAKSHHYTMLASENTFILQTFPFLTPEGISFKANAAPGTGLSPVYRFYNTALDAHHFTISADEKTWILANLPQMKEEGIAWYANTTAVAGTIPLYRFYNTQKGVHHYTTGVAERAWILANLPQMKDEGIAYYVLP